MFGRVIVAILQNEGKRPLFTVAGADGDAAGESGQFFRASKWRRVQELLAGYALAKGAHVILRGIRAISDYEYELQMALTGAEGCNRVVETIFLPASETFSFISSKLVKEVISLGE